MTDKQLKSAAEHKKRLVWDIPTRLFHWLLVLFIAAQWLTAEVLEGYSDIHNLIGYCILGLVMFRLVWGFFGTKYARFSNFLTGPEKIVGYLASLMKGNNNGFIGHNPLGGLLVPVVLILLGLQAISGLFISDEIFHNGPLFQSISDKNTEIMDWIHHNVFDVLLGFILLHLLAIVYYQWRLKQDLIRPMLSGKKRVGKEQAIKHSDLIKAIILIILIAIFIYWLVEISPPEIEEEFYF